MQKTLDEARDLKKAGVDILVVSVGTERNVHLLKDIASTKANYFEAENYEELFERIEELRAGLTREVGEI